MSGGGSNLPPEVEADETVAGLQKEKDKLQKQINAITDLQTYTPDALQKIIPRAGFDPWNEADCKPPYTRLIEAYAKLEKQLEVCNPCFPHPFLFYYSSMTHSQHVCVV